MGNCNVYLRQEVVMKEKKAGRVIIFIAFWVIICLSKGIWFFAEKYLDSANYENRQMATRPVMVLDNYGSFSSDYTSFFNDNLQFRNNLISLNSVIDYFCFGKSSSDYVIVGKDNWLFYSRSDDGNPISCYQGTDLLSEEELAAIANNCIAQRDFLLSQGKEFVIFIAPNKERMYSEFLPKRYGEPANNYGTLQIYNYLKANTDLRVVYPYNDLMDAKNNLTEPLWYKTDTHWNYLGGYVGASALMAELGIEMPKIYSENITISRGDNTSGDLAGMLNLSKQLRFADNEYSIDGYDLHNIEELEWDFLGLVHYRAMDADPRSIYVIRDSFSSHMALYIGSQFKESYLRHKSSYTYDDLAASNPDIVVYETVERYAYGLANFSIQ